MVNYKSKYLKYKLKLAKLNAKQQKHKGGTISLSLDDRPRKHVTVDKRHTGQLDDNDKKILAEVTELMQNEDENFSIVDDGNELFLIKLVELVKVYKEIKSEINIKNTFDEYLKIVEEDKSFIFKILPFIKAAELENKIKLKFFEKALKNQPDIVNE